MLDIPLGKKGPDVKGWQARTYEYTQSAEYLRGLQDAIRRGGNLGILLGPASGNVVAIDFDEEDPLQEFIVRFPWSLKTPITRGKPRGGQIWIRIIGGGYPTKRVVLKTTDDKPTIEFRGGSVQSVVWGLHPLKVRYRLHPLLGDEGVELQEIRIEELQPCMEELLTRVKTNGAPSKQSDVGEYDWLNKYPDSNIKYLNLIGLLSELGIQLKKQDTEKWSLPCPWRKEHTTDKDGEKDAVVWQYQPTGKRFPAFKCFHSHCDGRGLRDLLDWAENRKPGIVERYCKSKLFPVYDHRALCFWIPNAQDGMIRVNETALKGYLVKN